MKRRDCKTAALALLIVCLLFSTRLRAQTTEQTADAKHRTGTSQARLAPEDEKGRREYLQDLEGSTPATKAAFRQSCAEGREVRKVKDMRAVHDLMTPDASETCPLVIEHQVRDGAALEYYGKVVADGGGSITPQEALKNTAKAAMSNKPVVAIGNGRGFQLTSAMACDAGEVTGSIDSGVTVQSLGLADSEANAQKLKAACRQMPGRRRSAAARDLSLLHGRAGSGHV